MKYIIRITLTAFLLLPLSVSAADSSSYFCVVDKATGFYHENTQWSQTKFNVDDEKYILRPFTDKEKAIYSFGAKPNTHELVKLGKTAADNVCKINKFGNFHCSLFGEFLFSPDTGHFVRTHTAGYWNETNYSPYISIGKCSKI
jgi:hypothetical protein